MSTVLICPYIRYLYKTVQTLPNYPTSIRGHLRTLDTFLVNKESKNKRNIRPCACKVSNSLTMSLRNSILCFLVSDFQQRIQKILGNIRPFACKACKRKGKRKVQGVSQSQTARGRGNRQIQTSTNRTNVRKALRLALSSQSEVIAILKGLKNKNKMTHGKTYNKSPRRINHNTKKLSFVFLVSDFQQRMQKYEKYKVLFLQGIKLSFVFPSKLFSTKNAKIWEI